MKKKVIIIVIITIIICLSILTIYKYKFYKQSDNSNHFTSIKLQSYINNEGEDKNFDKTKYINNIINKSFLSINYEFYDNDESVYGKVFINDDGYLYITDSNKNIAKKLSIIKFKTMYKTKYEYSNIYIYLISNDKKLYYIELASNDITKAKVELLAQNYKIENFVNLEFKTDKYGSPNNLFVLADDGYIYDVASDIIYNEDIISLYNKFYILNDFTISNVYGKMLTDKNSKKYKIKYCFFIDAGNDLIDKNEIIFITQDNKLIYVSEDKKELKEFNNLVKDISYKEEYPYIKSDLVITFNDNSKMSFEASCNEYFCINKIK